MTRLEVENRTAELLHEQARARRLSIDEYLRMLAEGAAATSPPEQMSMEQFDRALDELAEGSENLPPPTCRFLPR